MAGEEPSEEILALIAVTLDDGCRPEMLGAAAKPLARELRRQIERSRRSDDAVDDMAKAIAGCGHIIAMSDKRFTMECPSCRHVWDIPFGIDGATDTPPSP